MAGGRCGLHLLRVGAPPLSSVVGSMSRMRSYQAFAAAALLFLSGCSEGVSDERPQGARLSPKEVLRIATRAAEREGIDVGRYKKPEIDYWNVQRESWSVFWNGPGILTQVFGDHLTVHVDDETGGARVIRGL